jgi:tRNA 2-thiouridine synthesizing protein E
MSIEVNGKTIETDAHGYLVNQEDWNEDVAKAVAAAENIEITDDHMAVVEYLRDEYFNHGGNQPNMRKLTKAMQDIWPDRKVDSKALYDLFPMGPAKQAPKVAGLPETKTKGGY